MSLLYNAKSFTKNQSKLDNLGTDTIRSMSSRTIADVTKRLAVYPLFLSKILMFGKTKSSLVKITGLQHT